MLSNSCFQRRECSGVRLKLVIYAGDFESLKEDHTYIYAYLFCINLGTYAQSICFIVTIGFEVLFGHVSIGGRYI